jgi:hypothetical protein
VVFPIGRCSVCIRIALFHSQFPIVPPSAHRRRASIAGVLSAVSWRADYLLARDFAKTHGKGQLSRVKKSLFSYDNIHHFFSTEIFSPPRDSTDKKLRYLIVSCIDLSSASKRSSSDRIKRWRVAPFATIFQHICMYTTPTGEKPITVHIYCLPLYRPSLNTKWRLLIGAAYGMGSLDAVQRSFDKMA